MKKIIIAIDGYSSTGKSTIAKKLAKALNYIYVDTGAMYRAVTLYALQNNFLEGSKIQLQSLIAALPAIELSFKINPETNQSQIHLNDKNVEPFIRNLKVSNYVSQIAAIPQVRYKLVEQQQQMGVDKGIVMDGRDIGTVVFPQAQLKIFMQASANKRAQRRYDELIQRGDNITYEQVLANVQQRDLIDTTRAVSPLKKAADAIVFDNSNLSIAQQYQLILSKAQKIIKA